MQKAFDFFTMIVGCSMIGISIGKPLAAAGLWLIIVTLYTKDER